MTDLRQTTATLVLVEELDGRFFIRNDRSELVVELYKPRGRRVELGVEPGVYEVRLEIQKRSLRRRPTSPPAERSRSMRSNLVRWRWRARESVETKRRRASASMAETGSPSSGACGTRPETT